MNALLKEVQWLANGMIIRGDIRICNGEINTMAPALSPQRKEPVLHFNQHFIYPGLTNAHDHLEMNLYPRMGNPPYSNYTNWGKEIYQPDKSPIKEIEKIPVADRLLWGGIKNLISGTTRVVHHNPWHRSLSSEKFPVRVLKNYAWSHSLAFGKNLLRAFPHRSHIPYIIHAAEGVDALAFGEIDQLNSLGLLKQNTVLIHAVAVTEAQINLISSVGASVVWCPSSNFFLFGNTSPVEKLKMNTRILLGSDSTLTGLPTLLDEMNFVRKTGLASAKEIYQFVSAAPATAFRWPESNIREGAPADFFVLPAVNKNYFENLVQAKCEDIELVSVNGIPSLGSVETANRLSQKGHYVHLNGHCKWIRTDVAALKKRIKKIAGSSVTGNPLWKMIQTD
jgi:cytosine/adenosine deaminase-related metal-dependent hydrolase